MSIIRLCQGETNVPLGNWSKNSHEHFINETSGLIGFKKPNRYKWVSPQAIKKLEKQSLKETKGFLFKNRPNPEKYSSNAQQEKPFENNLSNLQSKLKKYQSLA